LYARLGFDALTRFTLELMIIQCFQARPYPFVGRRQNSRIRANSWVRTRDAADQSHRGFHKSDADADSCTI